MATWREQKRAARRVLHETLAQPVLYIPFKGAEAVLVTARVHLSFDALGELRRSGFAEGVELTPQAIFLASEIEPVRLSVFVTEDLGAFVIDQTDPADDITVKVRIARLPAGKYADWGLTFGASWSGLPAPTV